MCTTFFLRLLDGPILIACGACNPILCLIRFLFSSSLHVNKTRVVAQQGRYQYIEVWDTKPYAAGAVAARQV